MTLKPIGTFQVNVIKPNDTIKTDYVVLALDGNTPHVYESDRNGKILSTVPVDGNISLNGSTRVSDIDLARSARTGRLCGSYATQGLLIKQLGSINTESGTTIVFKALIQKSYNTTVTSETEHKSKIDIYKQFVSFLGAFGITPSHFARAANKIKNNVPVALDYTDEAKLATKLDINKDGIPDAQYSIATIDIHTENKKTNQKDALSLKIPFYEARVYKGAELEPIHNTQPKTEQPKKLDSILSPKTKTQLMIENIRTTPKITLQDIIKKPTKSNTVQAKKDTTTQQLKPTTTPAPVTSPITPPATATQRPRFDYVQQSRSESVNAFLARANEWLRKDQTISVQNLEIAKTAADLRAMNPAFTSVISDTGNLPKGLNIQFTRKKPQ